MRSAVLSLALLSLSAPAMGHEAPKGWRYGYECCSDRDCKPAAEGTVRETANGYLLTTTGETVPYGNRRVKNSPDGEFHVCQQAGNFDSGRILCIYAPPRAY